jgi:BMFP domain-containing protein YqiC
MKQADETSCRKQRKRAEVSDFIWETFDSLFKTVHAHGRRVEELEARITDLEQRLNERVAAQQQKPQPTQPIAAVNEMPAERAA